VPTAYLRCRLGPRPGTGTVHRTGEPFRADLLSGTGAPGTARPPSRHRAFVSVVSTPRQEMTCSSTCSPRPGGGRVSERGRRSSLPGSTSGDRCGTDPPAQEPASSPVPRTMEPTEESPLPGSARLDLSGVRHLGGRGGRRPRVSRPRRGRRDHRVSAGTGPRNRPDAGTTARTGMDVPVRPRAPDVHRLRQPALSRP
jgi:hypothetical protein